MNIYDIPLIGAIKKDYDRSVQQEEQAIRHNKLVNDDLEREQRRNQNLALVNQLATYAKIGDAESFGKIAKKISDNNPDGEEYTGLGTDPSGNKAINFTNHITNQTQSIPLTNESMFNMVKGMYARFGDPKANAVANQKDWADISAFNQGSEFSPISKDEDARKLLDSQGKPYYEIRGKDGKTRISKTLPRTLSQKQAMRLEEQKIEKGDADIAETKAGTGLKKAQTAEAYANTDYIKTEKGKTASDKDIVETFTSDGVNTPYPKGTIVQKHSNGKIEPVDPDSYSGKPGEDELLQQYDSIFKKFGVRVNDKGDNGEPKAIQTGTASDIRRDLQSKGYDATFYKYGDDWTLKEIHKISPEATTIQRGGKQLTKALASDYLKKANGNKTLARQLAKKDGYSF